MLRNLIYHIKNISITERIASTSPLSRSICTTSILRRDVEDRREMLRSMPAPDEGTIGEKAVDIDRLLAK